MIEELKTVSLGLAFFFPFFWTLTLLFTGFYKQKSKIFLFCLMLEASFLFLMTFFKFHNHISLYKELFPLQAAVAVTIFPLIFMYIKSLSSEKQLKFKQIYPHFIFPFVVLFLTLTFQKILVHEVDELRYMYYLLDHDVEPGKYFVLAKMLYEITKAILVITSVFYSIKIAITLKNYYKKIHDIFSENDQTELRWIRILGIMFLFVSVFFVIVHLSESDFIKSSPALIVSAALSFAVFFWYLGLNGFRQREVYSSPACSTPVEFENEVKISKEQLTEYLEKHKPYINSRVTAFDFCYHFHTNRTYLSDAIRQSFDMNFRGLINMYRVREAKALIKKQLSSDISPELEDIALKAGFSSYSTFFRVFRSETGISPSDYLKRETSANHSLKANK